MEKAAPKENMYCISIFFFGTARDLQPLFSSGWLIYLQESSFGEKGQTTLPADPISPAFWSTSVKKPSEELQATTPDSDKAHLALDLMLPIITGQWKWTLCFLNWTLSKQQGWRGGSSQQARDMESNDQGLPGQDAEHFNIFKPFCWIHTEGDQINWDLIKLAFRYQRRVLKRNGSVTGKGKILCHWVCLSY